MIDHMGVTVRDLQISKAFYDAAFAPLGIAVVMSVSAEETGGAAFIGYGPTADRREARRRRSRPRAPALGLSAGRPLGSVN